MKRGPWFIGDHFLSIRPWEPFFTPDIADVSLIAVWIRLNRLPIELYEAGVLKQLGEAIGRVLRIDTHTAMEAQGIQKLCFSCGQVGHRKEAYPYTIRKEVRSEVTAERHQVGQVENPREVCEDVCASGMQATPNGSGMDKTEGQYGPWMVVSKKKPGQKGTKKSTSFEGTIRSTRNVTAPLMSDKDSRAATSSNGPPPGAFTSFNYTRPTGVAQEVKDKAFGNPFNPRPISQAPLPPKNKSKTSMKGMKVIAKGLGKRGIPFSADALQNQSNTFNTKSPSSFNLGSNDHSHGAFNFVALAKPKMGNMSRRKGSQNPRNYFDEGVEACESVQSKGLVQSQIDEGVEACLSTYGDECQARTPAT
nr:hypothetical protein CFP56_28444 [Quercus suber]